jgi:3'-phosphoadenosine 5'-phosphosulfate (PAPS) 3'-phosphatase
MLMLLPGSTVISAESAGVINRSIERSKSFWLVDSLDGTKEFLKRTNEFTVNLAPDAERPAHVGRSSRTSTKAYLFRWTKYRGLAASRQRATKTVRLGRFLLN